MLEPQKTAWEKLKRNVAFVFAYIHSWEGDADMVMNACLLAYPWPLWHDGWGLYIICWAGWGCQSLEAGRLCVCVCVWFSKGSEGVWKAQQTALEGLLRPWALGSWCRTWWGTVKGCLWGLLKTVMKWMWSLANSIESHCYYNHGINSCYLGIIISIYFLDVLFWGSQLLPF